MQLNQSNPTIPKKKIKKAMEISSLQFVLSVITYIQRPILIII